MKNSTKRLQDILKRLRNPETGCSWDLEQTQISLTRYIIEEAYETVSAIQNGIKEEIVDELGDLLLQIVFQSQIAEEQNLFHYDNVVDNICNKLERRHPHIFGEKKFKKSTEQQRNDWEKIKQKEREKNKFVSIMQDISEKLPPLIRSQKIQDRANFYGFKWVSSLEIYNKIIEEIEELKIEEELNNNENVEEEFGDLLFTVISLSSHLNVDPEIALMKANKKFLRRFCEVEKSLKKRNLNINEIEREELNKEWQEIKLEIKNS